MEYTLIEIIDQIDFNKVLSKAVASPDIAREVAKGMFKAEIDKLAMKDGTDCPVSIVIQLEDILLFNETNFK